MNGLKEGMFEVTFKVVSPAGTVEYTNPNEAFKAANEACRKYGAGNMHVEKVITEYLSMDSWYNK